MKTRMWIRTIRRFGPLTAASLQIVYLAARGCDLKIAGTMFIRELHQGGHTRRFSISERGPAGWEVRDEQDERVLKRVCYKDWHRVERALGMFQILIDDLESQGWLSTTAPALR